jgi:hypothetical protein
MLHKGEAFVFLLWQLLHTCGSMRRGLPLYMYLTISLQYFITNMSTSDMHLSV